MAGKEGRTVSRRVDHLLSRWAVELDAEKRIAQFRQIQAIIGADLPAMAATARTVRPRDFVITVEAGSSRSSSLFRPTAIRFQIT